MFQLGILDRPLHLIAFIPCCCILTIATDGSLKSSKVTSEVIQNEVKTQQEALIHSRSEDFLGENLLVHVTLFRIIIIF